MSMKGKGPYLQGKKKKGAYPYHSDSSDGSTSSGVHAAESTDLLAQQSPTSPQDPSTLHANATQAPSRGRTTARVPSARSVS